MRKIYLLLHFLAFAIIAGAQTTVSFTSDKDNSMYSNNGALSNAGGDIFVGFVQNGTSTHRGLVHFTLSGIPTNAVVSAVTLKLTATKFHGSSHLIAAHKVSNSWGEGTSVSTGAGAAATTNDATWTHRLYPGTTWATAGGDFTASASGTTTLASTGSVTFSSNSQLVADVQSWVTTPSGNNGWLIKNADESTAGNSASFASKEFSTATSRPTLTVTYSVVGPVSLKNFFATLQRENSLLQWQTVTESRSDFFAIQHSTDGVRFNEVGTVTAAGNSNDVRSYSFVHTNIGSGRHYYRLAQHDIDGRVNYSPVILVSTKASINLELAPNPAQKTVKVTANTSLEGATFIIVSASGQTVKTGMMNSQQIDVSLLRTGMYQLSIQTKEGEILRSQFIKN